MVEGFYERQKLSLRASSFSAFIVQLSLKAVDRGHADIMESSTCTSTSARHVWVVQLSTAEAIKVSVIFPPCCCEHVTGQLIARCASHDRMGCAGPFCVRALRVQEWLLVEFLRAGDVGHGI